MFFDKLYIGEFFIDDSSLNLRNLSPQLSDLVLRIAKNYGREIKHGMVKRRRFLFFWERTGQMINKNLPIEIIAEVVSNGRWLISLDMTISKFQASISEVNREKGNKTTPFLVRFDEHKEQWMLVNE